MALMVTVRSSGPLRGELTPPSDKSITHRALILGAMALPSPDSGFAVDGPGAWGLLSVPSEDETTIQSPLEGEDCLATRACLTLLGHSVREEGGRWMVRPGEWATPDQPLDCGNSGTTMRLLAGVLASQPGLQAVLTGDASLSRRPMRRVVEPLRKMGAQIDGDTAPLSVTGTRLRGMDHATGVASAQVKTCLLLAGLRAEGETWVKEPSLSRDHTERMLTALGVELMHDTERGIGVKGGQTWTGFSIRVPGDISSAAFWLCAAAMIPGSEVLLRDVGVNPTRDGALRVLGQAGASIERLRERVETGEPVADLRATAAAKLSAFEISGSLVPTLIDEIPVLAALATQCHGATEIRDAAELRVKESDRIARVAEGLRAMGASVEERPDGLTIHGPTPLTGADIDAEGDHRLGMAFAVAGLAAQGETRIHHAESIATSYPAFFRHLESLTHA